LAECCASIDRVIDWNGDSGEIYCLWGEFKVNREIIRGGLRFTLPECPNALAWTLTCGADSVSPWIQIHCTINRSTHEPEFIESIRMFVEDWRLGMACLCAPA
jgi:hypothetical protein